MPRAAAKPAKRAAAPQADLATGAAAEKQLAGFLAKYTPAIAALARAARAKLRKRLPGAVEMVYDTYNYLVIGFSPTERPSEAVLSIVLLPKWVTLCFLQGARLSDPQRVLKGGGHQVRNFRFTDVAELDRPALRALITIAFERSTPAFDPKRPRLTVVRATSVRQRPRRAS